ncbi:MAG: histone deacetylase [Hyphomicrobiales bacterium]
MLQAKKRVGLVFFPAYDWAISPQHPEREERLLYTQDQILEEGLFDIGGVVELKPDAVALADIQRVHFCVPDAWSIATDSHFISAGGAKTVGMAVLERKVDKGFALVRPPGHHAMRVAHGARGFCNINIEAVMIEFLRRKYGVDRVAIVDTDCHHGDGTQDIYWHDPDTLFISLHQDGRTLYPGSGFPAELGGPNAVGCTLNLPLPPHTAEEGFLHVIRNVVRPVLDDFKPQIVVNSAGQDNHYTDPITNMNFSAHGYAELTSLLDADIAVLEGGYSIEGALPYVNLGIVLAMAGLDYSKVREPDYDRRQIRQSPGVTDAVKTVSDLILACWQGRGQLRERILDQKDCNHRKRRIYYDTDGFSESQQEEVTLCEACGGALRIDSVSDRGAHILAVHIPRKACRQCREAGRAWYEQASIKRFDRVFLQDRTEDSFAVKKK